MARGGPQVEWRGAIELMGFNVNVALYKPMRKGRAPSFRILGPDWLPPVGKQFEATTGREISRDETVRGVEVKEKGQESQYRVLTPEAIEMVTSGTKTEVIEPEFVKADGLPLDKALRTFVVRADDNVPGAESAVNVLWNGLRHGLAVVSPMSLGSSMDCLLAIYVKDEELLASELPFFAELYPEPEPAGFGEDDAQATLFAQVVEQHYGVGEFDYAKYESAYLARREAAIEAVLNGDPVKPPKAAPKKETPDLMAVLAAAIGDKPKPKAKRKTAPKAKVKA